jgi:hypothetical protein
MATKAGVSATCIFCDDPPDSGEHLWSRWMRRLLHRSWNKQRFEMARNFPREAAPFGELSHWTFQGPTHHKKIKVVCDTCNTGWMSRLESASKFLKPMMLGQQIRLDREAQRIITKWIVLKILVLEHDPTGGLPAHPIFSRRARLAFKTTRKIPRGFRIWLNGRGGPKWHDSARLSSGRFVLSPKTLAARNFKPTGPGRNIQSVTWGIRNLLIHSLAITYPTLDASVSWEEPPGAVQLWPLQRGAILWPLDSFLTDWAVDELSERLGQFAGSFPRTP